MAEFPALPLWTDAYLGDTTHLTTTEHGAYLLLLITAWRTRDCALPDDDRLLARYARLSPQQWKRMRPILEDFFTVDGGVWRQGRLTDELDAVKRHRHLQSEKGKAGAAAKALKRHGRRKAAAKSGLAPAEAQVQPDASSHTHIKRTSKDVPKSGTKTTLADDWEPVDFGDGSQSLAIVAGWSRLEFERQLEAFRAHHRKEGSRFVDWQSAWSTWVLNSARFAERDQQPRGNGGSHRSAGGGAAGSALVDQILEDERRRAAAGAAR